MWATEDTPIIQPKTKGSGAMVRDFVDKHREFRQLSDEEHTNISAEKPDFLKSARVLFEFRAGKAGYWTGDKFLNNVKNAVKTAEHIYLPATHTIIWLFDQSSYHKALAEDSLNVHYMNVFPGGGQSRMHDTVWGRVRKMAMENGRRKGMKMVLEVRGDNTRQWLNISLIVAISCTSYQSSIVNLTPLKEYGARSKFTTGMHTNFTLVWPRRTVGPALDSVQADLIRKYFRRVDEYERAYLRVKRKERN